MGKSNHSLVVDAHTEVMNSLGEHYKRVKNEYIASIVAEKLPKKPLFGIGTIYRVINSDHRKVKSKHRIIIEAYLKVQQKLGSQFAFIKKEFICSEVEKELPLKPIYGNGTIIKMIKANGNR